MPATEPLGLPRRVGVRRRHRGPFDSAGGLVRTPTPGSRELPERHLSAFTGPAAALVVVIVVVLAELVAGERAVPMASLVIAPLVACSLSGPRATGFVALIALSVGVAIGALDGHWGVSDLMARSAVIIIGGSLAVALAEIRERRERSLARSTHNILSIEHDLVTILQGSLLPKSTAPSRMPGLQLATSYIPVNGRADVGGDWFDAFPLDARRLGLSIGDVSGHELESAIMMAQVRIGIRLGALQGLPPGLVLDEASRLVESISASGDFATAIFGIYHLDAHQFVWSRAGHCLPLIAEHGQARLLSEPGGPPLGVKSSTPYPTVTTRLSSNGILLLHTDGLYEHRTRSIGTGEALLLSAVSAALTTHGDLGTLVKELPPAINDGLFEDDVCILALQRTD